MYVYVYVGLTTPLDVVKSRMMVGPVSLYIQYYVREKRKACQHQSMSASSKPNDGWPCIFMYIILCSKACQQLVKHVSS